jgi:outer membrane protein OmpA-like peptidoglycan-associated protein
MSRHDTGSGMSNSLTDLMTSLAVIFVLLLCASMNNARQEGETSRNSILSAVHRELNDFAARGIDIKPDPKDALGILILVPENLLAFQFDKADIPPGGLSFLQSFVPRLSGILCSERFSKEVNSVVVEGHTDSSGAPRHNCELSQKRSMSVVKASLDILDGNGMEKERDRFLKVLSATGRGSAEPLTGLNGEEDMALSRRVVFKIRVRSLEQKPLTEVLSAQAG